MDEGKDRGKKVARAESGVLQRDILQSQVKLVLGVQTGFSKNCT